jgi:hypothetical protein
LHPQKRRKTSQVQTEQKKVGKWLEGKDKEGKEG